MPFGDIGTRALERFTSAFEASAAEAAEAFVAGIFVYWADEIGLVPVAVACLNTEAGIEAALRRGGLLGEQRPVPADAEEARWDIAYWSQPDLARFADPDEDPEGAAAVERWIRLEGLWYTVEEEDRDIERTVALSEQIDERLFATLVDVARELHRDVIPRVFGRPVPVLIQDPDFEPTTAEATRAANPPGLADDYLDWVARRPPDPLPWDETS
jgi:hypothetical protein